MSHQSHSSSKHVNHLHRRSALRGCGGVLLALPVFLTAKNRLLSAQDKERRTTDVGPRRFCTIVFPNGVSLPPEDHAAHQDWNWFPHETGSRYKLTKTLAPLEGLKENFSILSGLSHPPMRNSIAHITADCFLTGADSSVNYQNSISVDQLVASRIGTETRFPSLALSSDGGVGVPGRTQTLSFSASGKPVPSLSEPRQIFNRLFGVRNKSKTEQRNEFGRNRSILDSVAEEANALRRNLGQDEQQVLEEYAQSVREVEHRLAMADRWLDVNSPNVDPSKVNLDATQESDAQEYIRAILDLMYIAILTDSTRTITYQITSEDAKGIGDLFPKAIGLGGHHSLSHGTAKRRGFEEWARYDQFLASQLAYFMERLAKTADPFAPGQNLLDTTLVLYGCGTSQTHLARNYPLVFGGGGMLGLKHGSHYAFDEKKQRMCDLFVTLLNRLGIQESAFGDSQGSLDAILT